MSPLRLTFSMKPVLVVIVVLALFVETTLPFAITFKDLNYTVSTSQRNRRRNPQIVFEAETSTTVKTTTSTTRPTTVVTSTTTTHTPKFSETALNSTILPQNISSALSRYTLINTTEVGTVENDTVIIEDELAQPANHQQPCKQEETSIKPNNYLSDEYIRSKLCSNVNASLASNYRFDLDEKVCSEVKKQSHCGKNMIFYSYARSGVYGYCDCDYSTQIPLVYHPQTKRCYFMYQQGYCGKEEWVELRKGNATSVCTKNQCFDVGRPNTFGAAPLASRDMAPEYVPLRGDGPCVRLNQANPEFCPAKGDIVAFRWKREFYPNCGPPELKVRFLGDVGTPECRPGSVMTVVGTCEPEWDFD